MVNADVVRQQIWLRLRNRNWPRNPIPSRRRQSIGVVALLLFTALITSQDACAQTVVDSTDLNRLVGSYRWANGTIIEILPWRELGAFPLVAFDEDEHVRALSPAGSRRFTAGAAAAEALARVQVRFEPEDPTRPPLHLVWEADGQAPRYAVRFDDARTESVELSNGETTLSGTLLLPLASGPHPALVLLHGSGAQDRYGTLPFTRFLVRNGIAILTTDKRGVGASSGDWQQADFSALADDAVAAVEFLADRTDIDGSRIGVFGVSQGGWIGPLAASLSPKVALVVSVSGPSVTPAEQTLDLIENELRLERVPDDEIREALELMRLALTYGSTREGWSEYIRAREQSRERSWLPFLPLPDVREHPLWDQQRRFWHYDPAPAIAALRVPLLVMLGGRDTGIPLAKNRDRWKALLASGGHTAHSIVVLEEANHIMFSAETGSLFEIPALHGFHPDYRRILLEWLLRQFGMQSAGDQ